MPARIPAVAAAVPVIVAVGPLAATMTIATAPASFASVGPGGSFVDDDGSPHEGSIEAIRAAGITLGCAPGRHCPDDAVTRAEMATFLTRALGLAPMVPDPRRSPPAGNPNGTAFVPPEAAAVDTSSPDVVIGSGTPTSCTSAAVVAEVALGGVITFDRGPDPVTIEMTATARVFNDTGPEIVIDGGGLVTLSSHPRRHRRERQRGSEGGGGVFFVSNDRTGDLVITDSELRRNASLGFATVGYPGVFYLGCRRGDRSRLRATRWPRSPRDANRPEERILLR